MKASVGLNANRFVDLQKVSALITRLMTWISPSKWPTMRSHSYEIIGRMLPLQRSKGSAIPGSVPPTGPQAEGKLLVLLLAEALEAGNGHELERAIKSRRPDAQIFYFDGQFSASWPHWVLLQAWRLREIVHRNRKSERQDDGSLLPFPVRARCQPQEPRPIGEQEFAFSLRTCRWYWTGYSGTFERWSGSILPLSRTSVTASSVTCWANPFMRRAYERRYFCKSTNRFAFRPTGCLHLQYPADWIDRYCSGMSPDRTALTMAWKAPSKSIGAWSTRSRFNRINGARASGSLLRIIESRRHALNALLRLRPWIPTELWDFNDLEDIVVIVSRVRIKKLP